MEGGMILTALRQLAQNEGLVSTPAFESKGVAWVIQIDREGRFLTLVSTLNDPAADSKGRKPRPSPQIMSIPRRIGKTVNIARGFSRRQVRICIWHCSRRKSSTQEPREAAEMPPSLPGIDSNRRAGDSITAVERCRVVPAK